MTHPAKVGSFGSRSLRYSLSEKEEPPQRSKLLRRIITRVLFWKPPVRPPWDSQQP